MTHIAPIDHYLHGFVCECDWQGDRLLVVLHFIGRRILSSAFGRSPLACDGGTA